MSIQLIIILVYFALTIFIGVRAGKKTKSAAAFSYSDILTRTAIKLVGVAMCASATLIMQWVTVNMMPSAVALWNCCGSSRCPL